MTNELISIVLPCYRAERFLSRIIEDVLAQTYQAWELLIVSNGEGQEPQLAIARQYADRHTNIKVLTSVKGGVSLARNLGMKEAQGKWLAFVDADDRITPDHLDRYMEAVAHTEEELDIVVGGYTFEYGANNTVWKETLQEGGDKKTLFENACHLALTVVWNKLVRADLTRTVCFDTSLTYAEDALFCMEILRRAKHVYTIALTGYRYRWEPTVSANSHYHNCMERALERVYAIQNDIYLQIGMSNDEISRRRTLQTLLDAGRFIRNIFRRDCPMTIREKHDKINCWVFRNPKIPQAVAKVPCDKLSGVEKMIKKCFRFHSAWLITFVCAIIYRTKNNKQ